MSDFNLRDEERLSSRQVAERLVDIAYALTAGRPLELNLARPQDHGSDGRRASSGAQLKSDGDRVELELDLTWAIREASSATKPSRGD